MSRRIKVIFTLSVLLNILMAGAIGGHFFKRAQWMAHFEEGLSPAAVATARGVFAEGRKDIWPMIKDMRDTKQELMAAIKGPEFDEGAFDKAAEKVRAGVIKLTDRRLAMLKKIVRDLPAEERAGVAGKFVRFIYGFGKGPGKGGKERGPEDRPFGGMMPHKDRPALSEGEDIQTPE